MDIDPRIEFRWALRDLRAARRVLHRQEARLGQPGCDLARVSDEVGTAWVDPRAFSDLFRKTGDPSLGRAAARLSELLEIREYACAALDLGDLRSGLVDAGRMRALVDEALADLDAHCTLRRRGWFAWPRRVAHR